MYALVQQDPHCRRQWWALHQTPRPHLVVYPVPPSNAERQIQTPMYTFPINCRYKEPNILRNREMKVLCTHEERAKGVSLNTQWP